MLGGALALRVAAWIAAILLPLSAVLSHHLEAQSHRWDGSPPDPSVSVAIKRETEYGGSNGYILEISLSDNFSPRIVDSSKGHDPGQGHLHVEVGDVTLERIYCKAWHYDPLAHPDPPILFGQTEGQRLPFNVTLYSNDHGPYVSDTGMPLSGTVAPLPEFFSTTFQRPAKTFAQLDTSSAVLLTPPTISMTLSRDGHYGFNAFISTTPYPLLPPNEGGKVYVVLTWKARGSAVIENWRRGYCSYLHFNLEQGDRYSYDVTATLHALNGSVVVDEYQRVIKTTRTIMATQPDPPQSGDAVSALISPCDSYCTAEICSLGDFDRFSACPSIDCRDGLHCQAYWTALRRAECNMCTVVCRGGTLLIPTINDLEVDAERLHCKYYDSGSLLSLKSPGLLSTILIFLVGFHLW